MKLSAVVREHLIESGKTENEFFRHLQYGISILRECHMDFSGIPITEVLEVNPNMTVNLPLGYINYIKIATVDARGFIHALGLNRNMSLVTTYDECGSPITQAKLQQIQQNINNQGEGGGAIVPADFVTAYEGFADNWRNGELMGRFFGIGGGNNSWGYYRIDEQNGVIKLQGVVSPVIVLEYIADLSRVNGDFEVHPFLIECLKNGMYWKSLKNNLRVGLGEKQLAKKDYDISYRVAVRRFIGGDEQSWLETFRSGNMAAVKW